MLPNLLNLRPLKPSGGVVDKVAIGVSNLSFNFPMAHMPGLRLPNTHVGHSSQGTQFSKIHKLVSILSIYMRRLHPLKLGR